MWVAEDATGIVDVQVRFWMPEAALERRDRTTQVAVKQWVRDGLLTVTPGVVVDYGAVRAAILADATTYGVAEIGFDPWNAMQLAGELEAEGLDHAAGAAGLPHPARSDLGARRACRGRPAATWRTGCSKMDGQSTWSWPATATGASSPIGNAPPTRSTAWSP